MAKEAEKNNKKVEKKSVKKTEKKETIGFFKGIKLELSKVKWPEGKEIVKYSGATIAFCIVLSLFFEALNILMTFIKGLF